MQFSSLIILVRCTNSIVNTGKGYESVFNNLVHKTSKIIMSHSKQKNIGQFIQSVLYSF